MCCMFNDLLLDPVIQIKTRLIRLCFHPLSWYLELHWAKNVEYGKFNEFDQINKITENKFWKGTLTC